MKHPRKPRANNLPAVWRSAFKSPVRGSLSDLVIQDLQNWRDGLPPAQRAALPFAVWGPLQAELERVIDARTAAKPARKRGAVAILGVPPAPGPEAA